MFCSDPRRKMSLSSCRLGWYCKTKHSTAPRVRSESDNSRRVWLSETHQPGRISGKFRRCLKILPRFSQHEMPSRQGLGTARPGKMLLEVGPAFENIPGFSPPRPPQTSYGGLPRGASVKGGGNLNSWGRARTGCNN